MWSIIFEFFGRNKALPRQQLWKRKTNYTLKGKEKTSICFFLQGSWIVTVALLPCQVNVWLPPNPLLSRSTTVNSYLLVQAPRIKEDRQHNVILIPQSYPLNKTSKNIPGFLLCTTGCWYGALSRGFLPVDPWQKQTVLCVFYPIKAHVSMLNVQRGSRQALSQGSYCIRSHVWQCPSANGRYVRQVLKCPIALFGRGYYYEKDPVYSDSL